MNDQFPDIKTINEKEAIQWLKDHLPVTCWIVNDPNHVSRTQI